VAASTICRKRMASDSLIPRQRAGNNLVAEVTAQVSRHTQIDLAAENVRKLALQTRKSQQSGARARFELNENVHVAGCTEAVSEYRPKQGQFAYLVAYAKLPDDLARNGDRQNRQRTGSILSGEQAAKGIALPADNLRINTLRNELPVPSAGILRHVSARRTPNEITHLGLATTFGWLDRGFSRSSGVTTPRICYHAGW